MRRTQGRREAVVNHGGGEPEAVRKKKKGEGEVGVKKAQGRRR